MAMADRELIEGCLLAAIRLKTLGYCDGHSGDETPIRTGVTEKIYSKSHERRQLADEQRASSSHEPNVANVLAKSYTPIGITAGIRRTAATNKV